MSDPAQIMSARARFGLSLITGLLVGVGCWAITRELRYGLLALVIITSLTNVLSALVLLWPLDVRSTARYALREDVGRLLSDVLVLSVMAAGVTSIAILLASSTRTSKLVDALLAIIAVLSVWALLHTTYALRYARLYYRDPPGGISFNTTEPPRYSDFYYFAFNMGMTYQVSDTAVSTSEIRAVVLRHGVLSYLFGTLVLAATINLVLGLVG